MAEFVCARYWWRKRMWLAARSVDIPLLLLTRFDIRLFHLLHANVLPGYIRKIEGTSLYVSPFLYCTSARVAPWNRAEQRREARAWDLADKAAAVSCATISRTSLCTTTGAQQWSLIRTNDRKAGRAADHLSYHEPWRKAHPSHHLRSIQPFTTDQHPSAPA